MSFIYVENTDIGSRQLNEDFAFIKTAMTNCGEACLAVICDGVGGIQGDRASKLVAAEMEKWFQMFVQCDIIMEDIESQINDLIDDINYDLIEMGKQTNVSYGTTVSALLLIDNQYFTFHIGDTRIYKFSNELSQITEDQTMTALKIKRGQLTLQEARERNEKHILLQCVGVNEELEIENQKGIYGPGDVFLLCSDGLYRTLNDGELWDILEVVQESEYGEMEEVSQELVDSVKFRGEVDNITSVYIKVV
ncbi:MAG: serine/threonine-protein phosphatase [Clostridium sp.]|nr:serine/threonine-protein phosphatase [Clostridium sp.]